MRGIFPLESPHFCVMHHFSFSGSVNFFER